MRYIIIVPFKVKVLEYDQFQGNKNVNFYFENYLRSCRKWSMLKKMTL